MVIYNSLDVSNLEVNQELYLVRYSHASYPDYIIVKFKGVDETDGDTHIRYMNSKGVVKKIAMKKVSYRLFTDINEMARILYDCFVKRNINLIDDFKQLFALSQDERPELWI